MSQILANLDDINANLPSEGQTSSPVVTATDENTALLQISVARIVRGYLSRIATNAVLQGWNTPENTPGIVSEIAGKLIAAQLYFNELAKSTTIIDKDSFSQKRYDEAMELMRQVVTGEIILEGVVTTVTESLTTADFFPTSNADLFFTKAMEL